MAKRKHITLGLAVVAGLCTGTASLDSAAQPTTKSQWVYPGPGGKLAYKTLPTGDKIMDFSHAGYMGGGVALPAVEARARIEPSPTGDDDTANIQKHIDHVAALPLKNGFRGAVLLAHGTFNCAGTLKITASGVVLRGNSSGADKGKITTIKVTSKPHNAITVSVPGKAEKTTEGALAEITIEQPAKELRTTIADKYVPSGSMTFTVASTKGFAAGDRIAIRKQVTDAWVKFMHMDDLVRDGKAQTWLAVGKVLMTERQIAAVAGNSITLDVPLSDSFDAKYLNPPGTVVAKIAPPARVTQVGIEHLRIESPLQPIKHTEPHFTAIRLTGEDCWVRDVLIEETMNSVSVGGRRITLERVTVNRKALHVGSSRPGEFSPNATQVLVDRCGGTADNVWYVATGSGIAGPMVLLNCTFKGDGRMESHMRWSTGMLYDNCKVIGGGMDFRNRGEMGSGHGWSMGWGVAWNCVANDYTIQNPPGAANWMVGCVGKSKQAPRPFSKGVPNLPEGIVDSPGVAVAPQSLYLAQLQERLGVQAVKNMGY